MQRNVEAGQAEYDAVIIGAGHNGLACAVLLARAGWKVLVLERNAEPGGAIQSGEITRPGYVHDLWSTNQNLFKTSPIYEELEADFKRHGLDLITWPKAFGNVYPDGKFLGVHQDYDETLRNIAANDPADVDGWKLLYDRYQVFKKTLFPLYSLPLPSFKALTTLATSLRAGLPMVLELAQLILASTRALGDSYFHSPEVKVLLACWGSHIDFGPDVPGGTMFPFVSVFDIIESGIHITRGGAGNITRALVGLLEEAGGELRLNAEVRRVLLEPGRGGEQKAVGVELASGEQVGASRAVVANLTPHVLFGRLLPSDALPPTPRKRAQRFQHSPATMMIHLALSSPPRWKAGAQVAEYGYVHVAPYMEQLAESYTDAQDGILPADPFVIVGQTSAVDPSRAPEGGAVLYLQVRPLPREIRGDRLGGIAARTWDEAREAFADRVIAKLETYAPGLTAQIVGRTVFSPADLERANPNLIGGDSIGGSHHLHQNFIFRPFLGASRYKMPIENLLMVGASTWPGAGNNATSGYWAAKDLLNPPERGWMQMLTVAGIAMTFAGVLLAGRERSAHRRR